MAQDGGVAGGVGEEGGEVDRQSMCMVLPVMCSDLDLQLDKSVMCVGHFFKDANYDN